MPRKSSIHFKPVSNVRFAVSHSERTDLSEPAYLLPKEHQLGNVVAAGSLSENELAALFIRQKEGMTGQAKARGSSPFWEGVVVLSDTNAKAQSANLQVWKVAYEKATGHKVLHMSVHLDEGYMGTDGKPVYNPHAHVIVSRMDERNRVIKLERKELAEVQDLTAETLQMERGSTLAERQGKRGRAHIPHREYREIADGARLDLDDEKHKSKTEINRVRTLGLKWSKEDGDKLKTAQAQAEKVPQLEAQVSQQAQQIAQLQEQYRLARQAMKDSGEAKQADYQELKKTHEAALAQLKDRDFVIGNLLKNEAVLHGKVTTMTQENQQLIEANAKLEAEKLAADQVRFAAMAKSYQEGLAAGTPAHLIVPSPSKPNPAPAPVTPATQPKATKTASEAPKHQIHPIPSPTPEKPLWERLEASLKVFLDWVKGKGGVLVDVDTQQSQHFGPVVQLDDLHALQNTGRGKYAVHELSKLDRVPVQNDSKTEIHYRGGLGQVKGRGVEKGGRAD